MIRTLTLNPAVDRRVEIEDFSLDAVNRVAAASEEAGGKGINVAKVLAALGRPCVAHGLLGGRAGAFIEAWLDERGIRHDFVRSGGETRTNLKVVDPLRGTHTDINERGPAISEEELLAVEEGLFGALLSGDILVLSGSLPEGCDPGIYGRWIGLAREAGARSALDADGEPFRIGVAAGPSLVKPNLRELERLAGRPLWSLDERLDAMRRLLDLGVGAVALSLGAEGALFMDPSGAWAADALPVRAATTVGAGDAMLAALVAGLESGEPLRDSAARAVGAASAAVALGGSGSVSREAAESYSKQVVRRELRRDKEI